MNSEGLNAGAHLVGGTRVLWLGRETAQGCLFVGVGVATGAPGKVYREARALLSPTIKSSWKRGAGYMDLENLVLKSYFCRETGLKERNMTLKRTNGSYLSCMRLRRQLNALRDTRVMFFKQPCLL